jgi:hypothetical protein
MKRHYLSWLLVLCMAGSAGAAPSFFINNLVLTNRTNIDATIFVNNRTIFFDMLDAGAITSVESVDPVDNAVFQTKDTLYYTNNAGGVMLAQPGFNFETVTSTGIHPASSFNNYGQIIGADAQVIDFQFFYGSTGPIIYPNGPWEPGLDTPVSSLIAVSATDIKNSGSISVGDDGFIQLSGATLKLSGSLAAGTVSEVDTNAVMGRGIQYGYSINAAFYPIYAPAGGVYDLCWGITNGASYKEDVLDLEDLAIYLEESPAMIPWEFPSLASRNGMLDGYALNSLPTPGVVPDEIFPISELVPSAVTPGFASYVYSYTVATTNGTLEYYYNIIFVNNAFADSDITAQVGFSTGVEEIITNGVIEDVIIGGAGENIVTNGDLNGIEGIVKFSESLYDDVSGQTVTNSLYVIDSGAMQVPLFEAVNSTYPFDEKPIPFEITRTEPEEWAGVLPANDIFDPTVIYTDGMFNSVTVPMTNAFYVAAVGRNPETRNGLFPYAQALLGSTETGLPDLTNEPGGISITATKTLDVSGLSYRGNGFFKLNAPTLTGTPAGADCPNLELLLGNSKSPLVVSNLLPAACHRIMGDVALYSATWMNTETNDNLGTGTNPVDKVTNYFHYHVLVVDQDLRSTHKPTALDVSLTGSKVELDDPLSVMGSDIFQAGSLTVNSTLSLTAAAGTLTPANMPLMKTLSIGTNGSIVADTEINFGVVPSLKLIIPTVKNTPILAINNMGVISSGQTEIQSQLFLNGGSVVATNGGEIILNTLTNLLGGGGLGLTNSLYADADINLTSTSIQVTNSRITAGELLSGQLTLYATGELTDHYPATASTNVYSTNYWQVTGGFSLPVKPGSGDLFATQILTIASNYGQTIVHLWAGQDRGATAAGFVNNEVIGHLILDRTTNKAVLQFSAAGKNNAMYVDYLELRDLSYSDYHNGLVVDTNFTIYFANSNVDPDKLHRVYPNIVWVQQFTGPNSTAYAEVVTPGGTNTFPVNALLRSSVDLSSFGNGLANVNTQFPIIYTNTGSNPTPSPSQVTSVTNLLVANTDGVFGQSFVIWTTGQGRVTSSSSLSGLKAGQTISLSAVPAANWLFLDWSWPGPASPANVTNPVISFQVPTNAFSFVTANFVTNPLAALAGSYYGLFTNTNVIAGVNSGFVSFTMQANGVFSGKLSLGTNSYPFNSQFNTSYSATALATNGSNTLAVSLLLGASAPPVFVTGSVSNAQFVSSLLAYQTPGWTASNSAPQAGSYTLALAGNTNAAASPGGYSYGTATVDPLGNLKAIVTLADNASASQGVPLSKGGLWPLYFAPSGVPQTLLGWVAFDTNGAGGKPDGFTGTVTWVKPALTVTNNTNNYYTNGFTNTSVLLGSVYSAAYQRTNGLALANPSIALSGGNLSTNLADFVNAAGLETYTTADKTTLTLTINPASGLFTGQYAPAKGKQIPLGGAVLQNAGVAGGFFLGTNQSGAVWLRGN